MRRYLMILKNSAEIVALDFMVKQYFIMYHTVYLALLYLWIRLIRCSVDAERGRCDSTCARVGVLVT